MNALALALTDSRTMVSRSIIRMRRYPSMTLLLIGMPILFLLLFVYVFGGTLGAGLPGGVGAGASGRAAYLDYVTPAIVLMAAASSAQGTAISMAMDMAEGIVARFRTMAISPGSVLTGHVLGAVVQAMLAMGVLLLASIALGHRPRAGLGDWALLMGLLLLTAFGLAWLSVAMGLVSKSVETASNTPMFLVILPFLSSGFVPVDSMPSVLGWVAEHQPFTPIIDSVRGLLQGQAQAASLLTATVWCLAAIVGGYAWARVLYRRER